MKQLSPILMTDSSDFRARVLLYFCKKKKQLKVAVLLTFIICSVITSRFSPMHCTTPEHEPHSLSRLKIGLKLRVVKKVIVCRLSYVRHQRKYTPYGKTFCQTL